MVVSTPKNSEDYEEVDIRCPVCNSDQVVVCATSKGYYEVIFCKNCEYTNKKGCKNM